MKVEKSFGLFLHLLARGCAREQKHQIGMLGAARPDLLPVNHVLVALASGESAQGRSVGAARWLRHAESLQSQFSGGDFGQVLALLLLGAVPQDGAHRVHLGMAGAAVAPFGLNGVEHRCGRRQAEPGATILFGDQHGEIARVGECRDKFGRVGTLLVKLAPVLAGEPGAQASHTFTDFSKFFVARKVEGHY